MTKIEMLMEMYKHHWGHDLTEDDTYEDIKEEYETMQEEYDGAEYDMFPNGRDYDAEDEEVL